jgi:outer membrane protein
MGWGSRFIACAVLFHAFGFFARSRADDLATLYTLARQNDPSFQSARFAFEAAKEKRPEAFSALLPSLGASGSVQKTSGRTQYTDTPEINRQFGGDEWVLQLTQPLFRADNWLAYGAAKAEVAQASAQYQLAEEDLILRLSRAYFDELVAEHKVATTGAQVAALNEQLEAAQHSFKSGVASISDVDDSRSRAALARAQQLAASNDLDSARAALEAIIGEPPAVLDALRGGVTLPSPNPDDVTAWVQRAKENQFGVRAAEAAVRLADYTLDRSRAQRLPSVDLVASYGGNYSAGNITEPQNFATRVHDKEVSVEVTMPILDGGGMHAQVAEARAGRSKALADLTAAQRQATLDAYNAYAAIVSGLAQIQALDVAVSAGTNAVKGNRIGYRLGIRINSDVLNAEQQLYSSMQDLDRASYDTLYQELKLKAATGELGVQDLKAADSLLQAQSPSRLDEPPATPPNAGLR